MSRSDTQHHLYAPIANLLEQVFPAVNDRDVHICDESSLPSAQALNAGFDAHNTNNKPLRFVPQDEQLPFIEMAYEERIFQHGIIATRNNWHDFFNALVWKRFVNIKSALNAIHHQEMRQQSSTVRSRKRDLLTLFDECGVIVIASQNLLKLIKNHQWQTLFVEHKAQWLNGDIKAITFGHAMFEKYLQPYIGMTAQALLISKDTCKVDENDMGSIDGFIADQITQQGLLDNKQHLAPLPVLGIPGWHDQQDAAFYANHQYFRPKRS